MKVALSIVLAFMFLGCSSDSDSKAKTSPSQVSTEKEVVKEVVKEVEKVEETVQNIVEETTKEVEEVTKAVSTSNGEALFKLCSGCHGINGEKQALGKSKVIKGWEATKVEEALNGYKTGTYGGAMKSLMKSQVLKLSDTDIKALAEHISKL